MSIKSAADVVRAQGRYGDTQLMHVNPKEVEALQSLAQKHGKSLSVNPQTGLPEAFDLGAILPTIAGTAVGSMVGMPWLGAAVGGLGTYAATGSLEKGMMAGLGAFGGASMLGSLGGIGATSGTTLSASGAVPAAAVETAIGPASASMIESGMSGPVGAAFEGVNLAGGSPASMANYGQTAFNALPAAQQSSAMGTGIQQLMTNPVDTFAQMGGLKGQGRNLAMMAAPLAAGTFASQDTDIGNTESEGSVRQFDYDPVTQQFVRRAPVKQSEFTGYQPSVFSYAEGGSTSRNDQIQKLYQEIVGRPASESDLGIWNRNSHLSVDTIAEQMRTSPEAATYAGSAEGSAAASRELEPGEEEASRNQIARMYREYLKREPAQEEVDNWAAQLSSGMTLMDIQQGIKSSEESSGLSQRAAIESAYRDALGRAPDPTGLQNFQNAMREGMSPEQMRSEIMGSSEAGGIAAASQQRQQAFSPVASQQPQQFSTQAQQTGASMIPNRYQQSVNTPSQSVQGYNQLLANRANYEYNEMPMLDAMRPRTPEERQRSTDQRLAGPMLGTTQAESSVSTSDKMQQQIDDAVAKAMGNRDGYYNPNDGGGGYGGSEAEDGMGMMGDAPGPGPGSEGDAAGQGGEDVAQGGRIQKKYAQGGIASAGQVPKFQAGGDMADDAFVVPADVVSALGNGSTDAGVRLLNQYLGQAMPIEGEGDGLSDDVPATIEGSQPARVADGEVYVPPEIVAQLGNGDPERGAAMLYAMMDKIREAAHGKSDQQAEVSPEQVMPV